MTRPPPPRFLHERLDEGEVWVDLEAGHIYGLNETGRAILEHWRRGTQEPAAIAAALLEDYDADPDVITREVVAFLEEARARGFLEA